MRSQIVRLSQRRGPRARRFLLARETLLQRCEMPTFKNDGIKLFGVRLNIKLERVVFCSFQDRVGFTMWVGWRRSARLLGHHPLKTLNPKP